MNSCIENKTLRVENFRCISESSEKQVHSVHSVHTKDEVFQAAAVMLNIVGSLLSIRLVLTINLQLIRKCNIAGGIMK